MAIDLRTIDKRKIISGALAIGAALIATVLARSYIENSSIEKAKMLASSFGSAEAKQLLQRVEGLERANQDLVAKQNSLAQAQTAAAQAQTQVKVQSLAVKTPPGKRAITAIIDKLFAVGGLVAPGDTVDIIVHLAVPKNSQDPKQADLTTITLFQNVLILAVGTNFQPGSGYEAQQNATTIPITFALNPQEAELISFAQQHGTLQLVLRSPSETQAYLLPAATWESLSGYIMATQGTDVGVKKPKAPEPPVQPRPPIEIFKGGQVQSR